MADYTLPFATPQRVTGSPPPTGTGPGTFGYADVTLAKNWNIKAVFSNGGNTRYILGVNTLQKGLDQTFPPATLAYIHVLKSSAGGASGTWSEVGTPGAKEIPVGIRAKLPTEAWTYYAALQDCHTIIVARWIWNGDPNSPDYVLVLSQFDMSADTWGADLSSSGDANAPALAGGFNSASNVADAPQVHLAKRPSDGHIFAFWTDVEVVNDIIEANDLEVIVTDAGLSGGGSDGVVVDHADGTASFSSVSFGAFQLGDIGRYINIGALVGGTHCVILDVIAGVAIITSAGANFSGVAWNINGPNQIRSGSYTFSHVDVGKIIKITAGTGFNLSWGGSAGGTVVGVTGGDALVVYTPYTSTTFPPPAGGIGALGATGGSWRMSNLDFITDFPKASLSEFTGSGWLAKADIFNQAGAPWDFAPSGLIVGDDSRIHCLGWRQEVLQLPAGPYLFRTVKPSWILHRTLKSDNTLGSTQEISISPDMFTGYEVEWPNDRAISRYVGGVTEISWPYLFAWPNGLSPYANDQRHPELRVLKFTSADNPTLASEIVATGAGFGADGTDKFSMDTASNWSAATQVTSQAKTYIAVVKTGFGFAGDHQTLALFENNGVSWDASTALFTIPGFDSPLGSVTCSSYPGFVGMALTNGPSGTYEWDDIFYFELAFSGSTALTIGPITAPDGTVGVAYSYQIPVSVGGVLPYEFTIIAGSLPPGLTLNLTTGLISGTPTLGGNYSFTVQLADAICQTATAPITIRIPSTGLSIICDNPPNGLVGAAYSHLFPVSGGTGPYTYAITAGILPPGLALNASTGVISGTPTAYGTFSFTVQVTDSLAATANVTCSIVILAPAPPSVICDNPPVAQLGVFYSHAFPASSGLPPYTWAITAGALPPGITLNATTGVASGIPTASGSFTFTVTVTDALGRSVSVDCSIFVPGGTCPDPRNDVHPYTTPAYYKL